MSVISIVSLFWLWSMYRRVKGAGQIKPHLRKLLAIDAVLITVIIIKARVIIITITIIK